MSSEEERAVIGSILLRPDLLDEIAAIVRPADFEDLVNEQVFATIESMVAQSKPIDALTVAAHMRTDPILIRNGGPLYLHDLMAGVQVPANAPHLAALVADQATRRRGRAAMTRGMQLLDADATVPAEEALEMVAAEIAGAVREQAHIRMVGETIEEYLEDLDHPQYGCSTPWSALNAVIGSLVGGRVYIVAARPAVGKTIMAVQMALHAARDGYVIVHSLEMSQREINQRLISDLADVPIHRLQSRDLSDGEWLRIRAAATSLADYRLIVDDRTNIMPVDIGAHARTIAKRGPIAAIVVDYAQLMGGSSGLPRHEEVAAISRQIKLLARALDVPIILVSQLNRLSTQRADLLPGMSDLRESGALEQDADVVILLSMKQETDPAGDLVESVRDMLVDVAKNRHGPTQKFTLHREGEHSRLRNPTRTWEVPPETSGS
jgi:replicative DNA helicase